MPVSLLAIALLLLLIALNTAISRAVSRSVFYSTQQKVVQVGLVWLVPSELSTITSLTCCPTGRMETTVAPPCRR